MNNNNGNGNGNGNDAHQNGQTVALENHSVATMPRDEDTQLQDIRGLIDNAPVMQQHEQTATAGTAAAVPTDSAATRASTALASEDDLAEIDNKNPFARRIGPKSIMAAGLSAVLLLPFALLFLGGIGGGRKAANNNQPVELDEEGDTHITSEDYAAMQAEMEALRAQQAFATQQVDANAIDAAGRNRAQQAAAEQDAEETATTTATTPEKPTPEPTPAPAPAPAPARTTTATTTVSRPATARTTTVSTTPVASPSPSTQSAAPQKEPVDPFERRVQLQALGSYGQAPPLSSPALADSTTQAANPFATDDDYYIQTIAFEQPAPATAATGKQSAPTTTTAPADNRPLTTEELAYQQSATAVLSPAALSPAETAPQTVPEADLDNEALPQVSQPVEQHDSAVLDPRRTVAAEPIETTVAVSRETATPTSATPATPTAILPGTNVAAELPYGFSWQAGAPLPEVLLLTTEDIMAGEQAVIPAGTQFLAQAQVDESSGVVNLQIVSLFGDTEDNELPRRKRTGYQT